METWKTIPNTDGLYDGSDLGSIRRNGKLIKPHTHKKTGYQYCSISIHGKLFNRTIHRLIAQTFLPNPHNKPQVNHKNGIKTDNSVGNLEWATRSENQRHSFDTGLATAKGIKNSQAQLDEISVIVIREAVAANFKKSDIARYFKVSPSTITDIYKRRSWIHI